MKYTTFEFYWKDKNSKRRGDEPKNEYLLVSNASKSFIHNITSTLPYKEMGTIEVANKKDIHDFKLFLKMQGFSQR